ncbi:MAG: hypothetical protein ACRDNG_12705 [Gaiellaceae bacterium]
MTVLEVETPHGQANVHLHPAAEPRAALVLGHGAGGGVTSRDLQAVTAVAREEGVTVALVEQPYRVAGRRSPAPARQLDAVTVPTLVVQGARDPFGMPPAAANRTVVEVPGNHSLRTDLEAVGAAVRAWLPRGGRR